MNACTGLASYHLLKAFLLKRSAECMPMLFQWYTAAVDICTVLQPLPSYKKGVGLRGTTF